MTPEQRDRLRAPFPPESIGRLPRAGTTLDYVGHAAVTDRLLEVDPEWNWEPMALAADGTPYWQEQGSDAVMWIRLTVCGVTRLGVGTAKASSFELEKQLISDALRNAAMRFGVALSLWSREELSSSTGNTAHAESEASGEQERAGAASPPARDPAPVSPIALHNLKARARALQGAGVSIADARAERGLPVLSDCDADELDAWDAMLTAIEMANRPKAGAQS